MTDELGCRKCGEIESLCICPELIEEAWQIYDGNNCKFSAGWLKPAQGPRGVDTMYIRFEKDGVEPTMFYVRPDEMAVIAAIAGQMVARDCIAKADKK